MRRAIGLFGAAAVAAGVAVVGQGVAHADPSASDWQQLRTCESSNNYSANTGNGYYGAYQFDLATWRSVGGTGRPDQASRAEQDLRALTLYRMRGWAPWICAQLVGLKNDADAGSGVKPGGVTTPAPPSGVPAFPGVIGFGQYSAAYKAFQKQLAAAGYGSLEGTGWYGTKTLVAVKKLQIKMGKAPTGVVRSDVWRAAWDPTFRLTTPPAVRAPAYPGVLRFGEYSAAYKAFQKQLATAGYGSLEGTGWYGTKTLVAVKKLQAKMGVAPTGVVRAEVWKAAWDSRYRASAAPSRPSTGGSTSPSTPYVPATDASCKVNSRTPLAWGGTVMVYGETYRDLQCFQRALGAAYGLTGTGYFGEATRTAVLRLQARAGLPRTGKVDKATWNAAWTKA